MRWSEDGVRALADASVTRIQGLGADAVTFSSDGYRLVNMDLSDGNRTRERTVRVPRDFVDERPDGTFDVTLVGTRVVLHGHETDARGRSRPVREVMTAADVAREHDQAVRAADVGLPRGRRLAYGPEPTQATSEQAMSL